MSDAQISNNAKKTNFKGDSIDNMPPTLTRACHSSHGSTGPSFFRFDMWHEVTVPPYGIVRPYADHSRKWDPHHTTRKMSSMTTEEITAKLEDAQSRCKSLKEEIAALEVGRTPGSQ